MSRQQQSSSSYTSYTSYSSSSSSSGPDGQTTGYRETQSSYTDPSGTHVSRATQNLGEPVVQEERRFDSQGCEMLVGAGGSGGSESRRIEDVTDKEQAERDRKYEEAIEEEYAKREGGA